MKVFQLNKVDLAVIIGNALDHFDTLIYRFLIPILAPLFFPKNDPIVQLILTYALSISGLVTRPFGVFIFSGIAYHRGPVKSLQYSLFGVAIGSILMAFIPISEPRWITVMIAIAVRSIVEICSAGESAVARVFIMENKEPKEALNASHLFITSSMFGIVMASAVATVVMWFYKDYPEVWRIAFFLGSITAASGLLIRRYSLVNSEQPSVKKVFDYLPSRQFLKQNYVNILRAIVIGGLSYSYYELVFVFLNSFAPLISQVTLQEMMGLNTMLLVVDTALVPIIGSFISRFQPRRTMLISAAVLGVTFIPSFYFMHGASITYLTIFRLWVMVGAICFFCPLTYWVKKILCSSQQSNATIPSLYFMVSICDMIGTSFIGRQCATICLWIWYKTQSTVAPGIYLALLSTAALLCLSTKND